MYNSKLIEFLVLGKQHKGSGYDMDFLYRYAVRFHIGSAKVINYCIVRKGYHHTRKRNCLENKQPSKKFWVWSL